MIVKSSKRFLRDLEKIRSSDLIDEVLFIIDALSKLFLPILLKTLFQFINFTS